MKFLILINKFLFDNTMGALNGTACGKDNKEYLPSPWRGEDPDILLTELIEQLDEE